MPRVPLIEAPRVASKPVATPFSNANHDTGLGELAQGMNAFGRGLQAVEQAKARQDAYRSEAKKRADEMLANERAEKYAVAYNSMMYGAPDAMRKAEYVPGQWGLNAGSDTKEVATPHGFKATKGRAALESSPQMLERLEQLREELAEDLDDDQKALFRQRTSSLYVEGRRQIEVHTSEQIREAEIAAQKGLLTTGLQGIAADYADEDAVAAHFDTMQQALRSSSMSDEEANGKVAELQATVAKVRLEQFLSARDWKGASAVLEKSKAVIGPDGAKYQKDIAALKEDQDAEETAMRIVEFARDPENGRVDEAKAQTMLEQFPAGPARDEARKRLQPYLVQENRAWEKGVDSRFDNALSTFLARPEGTRRLSDIHPRDRAWLLKNAPKDWEALEARQERDRAIAARNAARGRGGARPSGRATPGQVQKMIEFRADIASNPGKYADPEYTPARFQREWGVHLSESDYKTAGAEFADTKKLDQVKASELARYLNDAVKETPLLAKNKRDADLFKARMGAYVRDHVAKKKEYPTLQELDAIRSELTKTVTIQRSLFGVDWLMPDDEELVYRMPPGAPAAPAGAAAPQDPNAGRVKMLAPNGKLVWVEKSRVEAAIASGGRLVE